MGTCGACGIKIDGQWKVSYNQFDSYPTGLGNKVVNFCKKMNKENGWDKFKENCRKVKLINSNSKPTKEQIEKYKNFADLSVSNRSYDDWYCLLCNFQGAASLLGIYEGKLEDLTDDLDFLKDSLFCEFAYIIDLDEINLLLFKGANKKPQSESKFNKISPLPFEDIPDVKVNRYNSKEEREIKYYPVEYRGTIPLNILDDNIDISVIWEFNFPNE